MVIALLNAKKSFLYLPLNIKTLPLANLGQFMNVKLWNDNHSRFSDIMRTDAIKLSAEKRRVGILNSYKRTDLLIQLSLILSVFVN